MWAATLAHNGMIACGRTADWASHRIEHELSASYDLTHGAGMALIFRLGFNIQKFQAGII